MKNEKLEKIQELVNSAKSLTEAVTSFTTSCDQLEKAGITFDQAKMLIEILDPDNLGIVNEADRIINSKVVAVQPSKPAVVEASKPEVKSNPIPVPPKSEPEVQRRKIIVSGYGEVVVTSDGHVFVNGLRCHEFINGQGYYSVTLPTKDGKDVKMVLHKLVAQAFLPAAPKPADKIVHKNSNPMDCRPTNLGWSSEVPIKNKEFDESIAVEICEELVRQKMDEAATLRALIERKIYTSRTYISKVKNKEVYRHIADKYFDDKGRPYPKKKPVINEKKQRIETALKQHNNDIFLTFDMLKNTSKITLFDVFNVKYDKVGKPDGEDVKIVIRYARSIGVEDIKWTLLNECALQVSEKDIIIATREKL